MSQLSRFLKRQERNVSGLYHRNLGDFVEEYKRPLMGAALGALGGVGIGALGNLARGGTGLAGATLASPAVLGAAGLGGASGAFAGYQRTQQRKAEESANREREKRELARAIAERDLNDQFPDPTDPNAPTPPPEDYTAPGQPSIPPTPGPTNPALPPVNPPGAPQSPESPIQDPINLPGVNPDMGNIDVGGKYGDQAKTILDEMERERQMRIDLWNQQQGGKAKAREELAQLLNSQMERQFSENVPGYLEDLNSRGLLRSSALGDRLSQERSKMGARVNEQLAMQAIQDQYGGLEGLSGIQNQYLQGRQTAMQRPMSLEDFDRQIQASKLLGQAVAPIAPTPTGGKGGSVQTGLATAGALAPLGK